MKPSSAGESCLQMIETPTRMDQAGPESRKGQDHRYLRTSNCNLRERARERKR